MRARLPSKTRFGCVPAALTVLLVLVFASSIGTVTAAPTTITAYKSTIPVNVSSAYSASAWADTATMKEPSSGITFAVKQNGTGWLFLLMWQTSSAVCYDSYCYGGIELGPLGNTAEMGSPTTPTIMILASPSFQTSVGHAVDEFIATGDMTPSSVESNGYKTQSVCGALTLTGSTYTVQCYRPFKLSNASPYDFPSLGVGSTIEIGFAVGEFDQPGLHAVTDMSTYLLTFSSNTYTAPSTSSTSSSSTSSSTTSRTTSTTSTTSTSTTTSSSSTATTTTTSSTSKSTTTSSTSSTSTTTTTSSSATTSSTSTTSTSSTTIVITTTFTLPTTTSSSSTATGATSTSTSTTKVTTTTTTTSPPPTVTMTVTGPTTTVTGPTTTVTGPTSTMTVTQPAVTTTTTSSVTTVSTSVPIWAYATMIVLLAIGLAVGYVVRRPTVQSA